MALPKINNVLYDLELPSSGEVVEYRPFLVKEEKILLMALEGKDEKEMVKAIKQIITQCVATEKFNINKLAMVDLEYLFLNIRGKAVGDISTIEFKHECGEIIKLDGLDLHHRLINFMGNDIVTNLHSINEDRIRLFRLDDKFVYTNKHVNNTFRIEHDDIIGAISKRDAAMAVQKLEYHNSMALKRAMGPPYF